MVRHESLSLILVATSSLVLGVVVYLVDRSGSLPRVFSGFAGLGSGGAAHLGGLGGNLPSFFHATAFPLLTLAALGRRRGYLVAGCLFWLAVEWLFEFAQHPLVYERLEGSGLGFPDASVVGRYFRHGTFDPLDLLASTLGVLTACAIALVVLRKGGAND